MRVILRDISFACKIKLLYLFRTSQQHYHVVCIYDKVFTPYISQQKMQASVKRVAEQINTDLHAARPLFLVVLNGSFMFAADLLREVSVACEISFVKLASYSGMQSTGDVKQLIGFNESVQDRTVVIVEDIVDTGRTVQALKEQLMALGAAKVLVAAALFKPAALQSGTAPEYRCFDIENVFVVGYGLDYNGQGRNLKEIHILA